MATLSLHQQEKKSMKIARLRSLPSIIFGERCHIARFLTSGSKAPAALAMKADWEEERELDHVQRFRVPFVLWHWQPLAQVAQQEARDGLQLANFRFVLRLGWAGLKQ